MTAPFPEPAAAKAEQEEGARLRPRFDANGLLTAVVSDAATRDLLMVAHMNAEALRLTIETGVAHYWSRARASLWKKGETSGALQSVREIRIDCDQDAVWLLVDVARPEDTCHTGRTTCFYRRVAPDGGLATFVEPRRGARTP